MTNILNGKSLAGKKYICMPKSNLIRHYNVGMKYRNKINAYKIQSLVCILLCV